jgi:hypothetical protein
MQICLYEEPGAGDTGLTAGREYSRNHPVDNSFVSVSENDTAMQNSAARLYTVYNNNWF